MSAFYGNPRLPVSKAAKRMARTQNRLLANRGATGEPVEYTPEGICSTIWLADYRGPYTDGHVIVPLRERLTERRAQAILELDGFGT